MKNYSFLFYFLCLFTSCYSQNEKLVRSYYNSINLAELAIVDNKVPDAKINYDQAFKTGLSFPIDKYNAFRLSYITRDTLKSIEYFNDLARIGQDKEQFLLYFFHVDAVPSDPYITFVTKDYDKIHKKALGSKMPVLAKMIDAICDMDQTCRKDEMPAEEFRICNRKVREKLYDYISLNGFPSTEKVGLFEELVRQAPNPGTFDFILWHCRGMISEEIYTIGFDNVKKGVYDARKFARGFVYQDSPYEVSTSEEFITQEKLKEINIKRAEIFLEPLEDHSRKIEFMRKYKMAKMDYWFVDPFMYGFVAGPALNSIR